MFCFKFVAVEKLNIFCLRLHIQILILVYQCISVLCCRSANSQSLTGFLPKNMTGGKALVALPLKKNTFFCGFPQEKEKNLILTAPATKEGGPKTSSPIRTKKTQFLF